MTTFSKEFGKQLSRIKDDKELESALEDLALRIQDSTLGQRDKDRAGYLLVENIARLSKAQSQRRIYGLLMQNNPHPSRGLSHDLDYLRRKMSEKEAVELVELMSLETTAEGQEVLLRQALSKSYFSEEMAEALRKVERLGPVSREFSDYAMNQGFGLEDLSLLLSQDIQKLAEPWLKFVLAAEMARESNWAAKDNVKSEYLGYGIELAIGDALEAGMEKSLAFDIVFGALYPSKPENFRLRSDFLRWAQDNGEKELTYEICAIDPELREQNRKFEQDKESERERHEKYQEQMKKYEDDRARVRKVVDENAKGLSLPNNPFAEQLKGFKNR